MISASPPITYLSMSETSLSDCLDKRIYGVLKMVRGESPRIMFDIIMGRFEDDYNPNIFYDASCRLKEFGMNREPKRFKDLLITTDPVHCVNHTT